jgi:tuberculosinol/isotuberculosinol synthase
VFANDATDAVADFSAHYYEMNGRVPEKRDVIEMYYGEYVEPVDLFIGFDRFSAFDMPLLATGEEDLYFTVSPSPYLDQAQLRGILFDHLFKRPAPEPEYSGLLPAELDDLRNFYATNRLNTLGTGKLLHGIWIPELCN